MCKRQTHQSGHPGGQASTTISWQRFPHLSQRRGGIMSVGFSASKGFSKGIQAVSTPTHATLSRQHQQPALKARALDLTSSLRNIAKLTTTRWVECTRCSYRKVILSHEPNRGGITQPCSGHPSDLPEQENWEDQLTPANRIEIFLRCGRSNGCSTGGCCIPRSPYPDCPTEASTNSH